MRILSVKYLLPALFCLAGMIPAGSAAEKSVIAGFGDRSRLAIEDSAAVENDGNTLVLRGQGPKWNRFLRTRPGVLKPNTDYEATFRYRTTGEVNFGHFLHILVRPFSAGNADSDLLQVNFTPGKEFRRAALHFRTGERTDYAFQIHSCGPIRAEIADLKLAESAGKTVETIANRPEPYTGSFGKLPSGAREFEVERPRNKSGVTVNAAEFGVSEKNADNIEALNKAIAHCAKIGAAKLVLNRGAYRMTAPTPLRFDGLKDFEFDGGGSVFLFHRVKPGILNCRAADCERTVLRNFSMDWDWETDPLASLVEAVGSGKNYVDFKLYEYDRFPKRDVTIANFSAYDPVAKAVGREGGVSRAFRMTPNRPALKTEWISDNVLRIFMPPDGIAKGDHFRLQHYYYNDNDGFHLYNNRNFSMEDINIYSCAGHAIKVDGHQKYWQFLRVRIAPPKGVPRRPISSTADHCHIVRSNGFMKILDCEFGWGADDCLNLHDIASFAVKSGPNSVRTLRRWPDSLPRQGEIAELRNGDYSPTGVNAPVREIREIDRKNGTYELVFDCAVPDPIRGEEGFILFNHSYDSRNIIVRNSTFQRNRARGLLLLGRDITIENNRFYHNEMGAIKIETGYTFDRWSEGYGASNIVVRGNVFDTVNPSDTRNDGMARDIYIGVYLQRDPSVQRTDYPILRDILFENNTFRETFGLAAFISSAENVTFRDNTFINTAARRKPLPYRGGFYVTHARDVRIVNNRYVKSPLADNPRVIVTPESTREIVVQGNRVVDR